MNDHTLRAEGLDELKKNLDELVKKYPDRAGNLLRAEALSLRKNVASEMRQKTNVSEKSKKSLGKIRNTSSWKSVQNPLTFILWSMVMF